jgi:hypothetical protein
MYKLEILAAIDNKVKHRKTQRTQTQSLFDAMEREIQVKIQVIAHYPPFNHMFFFVSRYRKRKGPSSIGIVSREYYLSLLGLPLF